MYSILKLQQIDISIFYIIKPFKGILIRVIHIRMCIISGTIEAVTKTNIFVIPSKCGKRQMTIYTNNVSTPESNVMCLPVPNPKTVKFENVSNDIFVECARSFNFKIQNASGTMPPMDFSLLYEDDPIEIISHGSYEVALISSMNDLYRVPSSFTVLTNEVIDFLQKSYKNDFGVILCKLKKGSQSYEPFAYSHDIQETEMLFVPTKHYHVSSDTNNYDAVSNFVDDWDHTIYSVNTPEWCHKSNIWLLSDVNAVDWSKMPTDFVLNNSLILRCQEIYGYRHNSDIEMPIVMV